MEHLFKREACMNIEANAALCQATPTSQTLSNSLEGTVGFEFF